MSVYKILLVDDDVSLLRLLSMRLESAGFIVKTAASGLNALGKLDGYHPHLVISDLRMEGMDGLALFNIIQERYPSLPVIILTAHGTIPDAVDATNRGVFSYLTKPFDSQQLILNINTALSQCYPSTPSFEAEEENEWRNNFITQSPLMDDLLDQVPGIAQSNVSVLIQSESGTGKELLAQAIHQASPRSDKSFEAVNCSTVPDELMESELFGHRKGAFAGADKNHTGLFENANGGTVYFDEVDEMPKDVQAKLLRVLEDGEIRPVGAIETIPVDVRIISATHSDIETLIKEGQFREDLYNHLSVMQLELPGLTERKEDIPLLANHFLQNVRRRSDSCVARSYSPEAMQVMMEFSWPGHVRQLLNVVEQVAILAVTPIIADSLVKKALRGKTEEVVPLADAQSDFERDYLVGILQITKGNVTQSAKLAKRNRTEFYKLLKRHHLEPKVFRHD